MHLFMGSTLRINIPVERVKVRIDRGKANSVPGAKSHVSVSILWAKGA